MEFEILSEITHKRKIAEGKSIRVLDQLVRDYGPGRWRKMSGIAYVQIYNGQIFKAEIHWYEAHGIGSLIRKKIKRRIKE